MMNLNNSNFLLLRTPLQSLKHVYSFGSRITPIFGEGIYLSSLAYWQEFQKRDTLKGKDKEKLERTFAKYWIRSCMRSTPYGTFAGSTILNVGEDTKLIRSDSNSHIRKIRVDTNYITELVSALTQLPHIFNQLKFHPNNSLYELSGEFRYAEYTISNNSRNYQLTSVGNTPYLKAILGKATQGATIEELAMLLTEHENVSVEEAKAFITEIWRSQLIVSELEPCVTGKEPLDYLIERLDTFKDVDDLLSGLKKIQQLILEPNEGVAHYQAIEEALKSLEVEVSIPKNTLQTDLFLATQKNRIDKELVDVIIEQAADLLHLAVENKNSELEDFKNKFYARYEDAEIPLAIALDADIGIGYAGVRDESAGGSELVDDLAVTGNNSTGLRAGMSYIEQFTLLKYNDYLRQNKSSIEITDAELKGFKKQTEHFHFPNSLYLMGSLMKKAGQLDKEHFVFDVSNMGGPSAGNLLGRFTHGDDRLCQLTKELMLEEEAERPEVIYAEIAHLPQARTGNILLRPVLRRYEIPYVGKSGISEEQQIVIEDLMVSVRNNQIVLRSRKHNKEVIPRLTTAHNFSFKALPVYKFLCDLQGQGLAFPNVWDWGSLGILKHLPRVSYKNLVLKKAKWKIEEKDIKDLPSKPLEYSAYFKTFCEKHAIPQTVIYAEADNELLIDFGNDNGIDLFLHYLKRYKSLVLEEFLFTEENCIVTDTEGLPYTNEIIIPLQTISSAKVQRKIQTAPTSLKRKYSPNSEWQYFKVYCGSKTAEKILSEVVLPFVEKGTEERLFERFFFIRFRDDAGHFRIRFYNSDIAKQPALQSAFMALLQPFLDSGAVDKIMLDTYNRELERYSAELIEETEILFHNDSLAILRFINMLEGTDSNKYRLLFALRGIDILLDDFGFDISEKQQLLKAIQEGFFKEFGGNPILQKQLNEKYRKHQPDIFSHLNPANDLANEIDEAVTIFEIRSEMNAPIILAMKEKLQHLEKGKFREILASYIHMFMNRLFIAQQRKYELVVYHFIEKYYASQLAIGKKKIGSSKVTSQTL